MRRRLAICSGLQPCTQRRSPRCGLFCRSTSAPAGLHPDRRDREPHLTAGPARTRRAVRSRPAWPPWVGGPAARHATAQSMPCTRAATSASMRCGAAPARPLTGCDAAAARSPAPQGLALGEARSPRARRTTGNAPTPLKKDRDSRRQRGGTTETPPAKTHRPRSPRPRSSAHDRSRPKTGPDPRPRHRRPPRRRHLPPVQLNLPLPLPHRRHRHLHHRGVATTS